MISIIDYGMGNLRSVQKACEYLGLSAKIVDSPDEIHQAEKLILPGVGAFRDAMGELRRKEMVAPIREYAAADKPLLGICLGMQLFFDKSYEDGEHEGLGLVAGEVIRFEDQPGLKIPLMGWNNLEQQRECPLLNELPDNPYVYFVHSYHVVPEEDSVVVTRTPHGISFVSLIQRGNLFATQFHPEKSQKVGLKLLSNFAAL